MSNIQFTLVRTPDLTSRLGIGTRSETSPDLRKLDSLLTSKLRANEKWTAKCSSFLTSNLSALYMYDRLNYSMSRAYGHVGYKVLLNPKNVFCYHPSCLERGRGVHTLKHIFYIKSYVAHIRKDHLMDHIGVAMEKRFSAIVNDNFITDELLDEISPSPYALNSNVMLNEEACEKLSSYGIVRDDNDVYTCHWKGKLISSGIIKTDSLSFQEDEALIESILTFPNPIRDWSLWGTLSLYCLKIFTSIGSAGLNLYRGITRNRLTDTPASNVQEFVKESNHPGPSVSVNQKNLPPLNYDSQQWHPTELIFHIKCMQQNDRSVFVEYPNVKRFLTTMIIDEQELNQGAFVHKGNLCGLKKPMSVNDIQEIGMSQLGRYVSTENSFVISVREYRLSDFSGYMCSNLYTTFETEVLKAEVVIKEYLKASNFANSCLRCLVDGKECSYENINDTCSHCSSCNETCISMLVLHNIWDMGSTHKKAKNNMPEIDMDSDENDVFSANLQTVAFGGLHLVKAIVNSLRNHILSYAGENYGLNILRSIKTTCSLLDNVKQAVFVAKDRQSDLLSYLTCSPIIQNALHELKTYSTRRIPEAILTYSKKADTQKDIISPVAVLCNGNGDVFILDSCCACVHVVDRSAVSKVFFIGRYCKSNPSQHKSKVLAKEIPFTENLTEMIITKSDDVFILDEGNRKVFIVPDASLAKSVPSKKVNSIPSFHATSIGYCCQKLVVLSNDKSIKILDIDFGSKYKYELNCSVTASIMPQVHLRSIFSISESIMGGVCQDDGFIRLFELCNGKLLSECSTNITSEVKPCATEINDEIQVHVLKNGKVSACTLKHDKKSISLKEGEESHDIGDVRCYAVWGKVIYSLNQMNAFLFSLEETGPLSFGYKFSQAINSFYEAIGFTKPGHGVVSTRLMLKQSIEKAQPLVELLENMDESLKSRFNRTTFQGEHGTPWTATVSCVLATVESWKALARRLDMINPLLSDMVYSHSITNESWIEHSFGFQVKQGQGQLMIMQEYIQAKRRHAIDFQMRMTNTPFCQYTKTKIRDKGYQCLVDVGKTRLSYQDVIDIFRSSSSKHMKNDESEIEVSEEGSQVLHKAYLLLKSVPRQSNRCKWRERSGFQPNLLLEQVSQIKAGDMVFSYDLDDEILNLLVKNTVNLDGKTSHIKVLPVGKDKVASVSIDKLLVHKGHIATVPRNFYEISDGSVIFHDAVNMMMEELNVHTSSRFEEDEENFADESEPKGLNRGVKRKRSDCDLELVPPEKRHLNNWVKVIYDEELYLGNIIDVNQYGTCKVQCLTEPFNPKNEGVYQDLEHELVCAYFHDVYETDVIPEEREERRRGPKRYIYGSKSL